MNRTLTSSMFTLSTVAVALVLSVGTMRPAEANSVRGAAPNASGGVSAGAASESVPALGWFDRIFNSPSNHRVHHATNLRYLDANYGGILIIFDRMFGTYVAECRGEPCRYGLVKQVDSHNPLGIVFHEWIALWRDLKTAKSVREWAGYLIAAPGWRADGRGLTTKALRVASSGAEHNAATGIT
jgi:hypothetical protein